MLHPRNSSFIKNLLKVSLLVSIVLFLSLLASCSDRPAIHSHEYSTWEVKVSPTCESSGSLLRRCDCGDVDEMEVDALGHAYTIEKVITQPSCIARGWMIRTCKLCGDEKNEILSQTGHTTPDIYDVITEEYHAKKCTGCGKTTRIEAHYYSEGECIICQRSGNQSN